MLALGVSQAKLDEFIRYEVKWDEEM